MARNRPRDCRVLLGHPPAAQHLGRGRSLKYEAVYLQDHADARNAERVVGSWFRFYGESRPHSSLGRRTPGEVYRGVQGEAA